MKNDETNELYKRFKAKLELVAGECYRVNTAIEAGELVCKVLGEKGIQNVALLDASISKKGDFANLIEKKGITVYTDHFREVTPEAQAGITQVNYAIAELGTLVQADADANVDQRLCSTLVPIHIALVSTVSLIASLKETMATLHGLPQIPGFVGFITGPSRTSDIERVLTIGVHGPKQLVVVFVDEETGEVA
ncbi:LutC/YkgG family protein [Desulfosporosinus nitroreducens]|uniref:Lactate utilization protein n=1 Tax=Desulfosporosinus nitroreducens TaxID=2018668 RepID=A0ABT8QJV3_9FIRM|nr:lactate utilization protein [Desulfosporosinus nitroreducens]MDO0821561.1 lactate utilization protein [Desulfosporosinus nitroreducens]